MRSRASSRSFAIAGIIIQIRRPSIKVSSRGLRNAGRKKKMPFFDSSGTRIHYQDAGAGDPVVLVHGFASTADHNWGSTGWMEALPRKYRAIAPDVRGHGLSDKPRTPEAYGYASMGADVTRLMEHLGMSRAILMGYSM